MNSFIVKTILTITLVYSLTPAQNYGVFNDKELSQFKSPKKIRVIVEDTLAKLPYGTEINEILKAQNYNPEGNDAGNCDAIFSEQINNILKAFEYQPVEKNESSYDATLIVRIKVHPLGKVYYAPGIPFQVSVVTGVEVDGLLQYCFRNKIFASVFSGYAHPPDTTEEFDIPIIDLSKINEQKNYQLKGRLIAVPSKQLSDNPSLLSIPGRPLPYNKAFNPYLFNGILEHFFLQHDSHLIFNLFRYNDSILEEAALRIINYYEESFDCEILHKYLNDTNSLVRITAAKTMQNKNCQDYINALLTMLKDNDPEIRRDVIICLGNSRNSKVVRPLLELLKLNDSSTVQALAVALENFPAMTMQELNKIKPGENKILVNNINFIKQKIGNFEQRISNASSIYNSNLESQYDVRINALKEISNINDNKSISFLIQALSDKSDYVSEFAIREIVKHGEYPVDLLIEELNKKNEKVRIKVISCLGKIKCARAIQSLKNLLGDSSLDVVRAAIYALGEQDNLTVIPVFEKLLKSNDIYKRCTATSALSEINDPKAFKLLIERLRLGEDDNSYLHALSKFKLINIDTLVNLFNDQNERIKNDAMYIANNQRDTVNIKKIVDRIRKGQIPSDALPTKILIKYLKDEAKKYIKNENINILELAELKDTSAIRKIVELRGQFKIGDFPYEYIEALKNFDEQAVHYLIDRINNPQTSAHDNLYYINILGRLCHVDAIQQLLNLCESEDEFIKGGAREAFKNLTGLSTYNEDIKKWYSNFQSYFN